MSTQRITLEPDPPVAGQALKVCYDFAGSGITETTLRIEYDPSRGTSDEEVSISDPCVTVTVPSGATAIAVTDIDGPSVPKTAPVVPS